MERPFISIAIPFYNAEEYLVDSIKAIFAQTYSNWELILIDDGSSDGSLAIANSVDDNRVRVYSDGKNKKLARRLNEIAHLAKYDYLARMDADDIIAPEKLELQIRILLDNPTLDLVTTGVVSVSNDLTYVRHRGESANSVGLMDLVHKTKGVTHASILGKKSWFLRNPYDEFLKVAQDYSLWVTAA
ncbi:glycosyltransferase family 2 protein, partial [Bacteroidia bacterium]|nr:glycosyltransferase family 2 protein [Bacteroidia bacterium]